jgi:uncharacterized repeat protein (TIGR01451 family)
LQIEFLEDRRLLDASLSFTHIVYDPSQGAASSGSVAPAMAPLSSSAPVGLTPAQIRSAYGVNLLTLGSITGDGTGQTIAIIDAYDDPDLVSSSSPSFSSSDLHKFDLQFGLADPPSFTKLNENGGTSYPAASGSSGWSVEESLDVEWAHALAPGAKIVLIEANSDYLSDLGETAVNTARNLAGVSVVSMSFGGDEFSGETSYDTYFTTPSGHQGVTFVASTGDDGAPGGYPAYSPNVLAVGGTTLTLSGNNYGSETGWSGSGGGQSVYEPRPSYQNSVQTSAYRQIPDVAFDADPNSGVAVYDSYDYGSSYPWVQVGGTSVSAPCWAGLVAIADQLRVSQGLGTLDGPSQTLPRLYALPAADFHDITSGSNGYSAHAGYDLVTGRGTPVANLLVPDLASYPIPDLSVAATHSGTFKQGDVGDTYTLTVSNAGTGPTSGTVSLVDTLPAGLTATAMSGTGWTVNLSTLTATRSDALAAGSSYPAITVTVNVAANAPTSVTNTATVSGGGEINTANDTASDATSIAQLSDLTVAISHRGTFKQGDVGDTYTITASNLGFSSTSGAVSVVDTLPAGLTATAMSGAGWNVNFSTLTATRSDPLGPGASYSPLTVIVNVAANAPASLTNTATVSGGGETNTANDTASDTAAVQQPDLAVALAHSGTFKQGDLGDAYTLTVSNVGLSATNAAVSLVDTLPAGLSATAMTGAGWTVNLSTLTATRSDVLAAGASYPPVTVVVNVAANASTSVTNKATVSGGGETNTTNDTASDVTTIQQPDLAVALTQGGTFKQGDTGDSYTITVSNVGLVSANGAVNLSDSLPAGLTATAMTGAGWNVNFSMLTAVRSDSLGPGASYPPLTVTVNVAINASASVTNTATVSGGGETNTVNDTASDATAITQLPDLTVAATHSGTFHQGDTGDTCTLTVSNKGTGPTAGTVSLVDTLPPCLTATAMSGTGWTVNLATLTATRSDVLAAGSNYPAITLTVSVAANAPTSATNTATVSGGGEVSTGDDIATDATSILNTSGPPSILSVTPSLAGGVLVVGSTTALTVTFGEAVIGGGSAANYELQSAGPDGLLGTADDVFTPLTVTYSGTTATLSFASLTAGVYRLTVSDAITDASGNRLDGNGDGVPGGNFVRDFVVAPALPTQMFGVASTPASGGTGPTIVATGDFNGDGKMDIADVNYSSNTVGILLGNGSGGFGAATTFSSGGSDPEGLVVGDFNGDGNLDLATTNWPSGTVGILLGNGSGGFTTTTVSSGGSWPDAIAMGDFNHDGKLDLAVANGFSNTVSILLGNGNGTFSTAATYSSGGSWPQGIAVGDFNRDGNLDVVVSNASSGNVGVLLGNGSGGFSAATTYSTGGNGPLGMAVGDFNGDGKLDLAVANKSSGTVGVLLGNGTGGFSAAATYAPGGTTANAVAVGDFNKDGIPDLVVTNGGSGTVGLLLGNGNGTFAAAITCSSGGSGPYGVAIADFNGDGYGDLAVGNQSSNTVGVLLRVFPPVSMTQVSPGGYDFDVQYGGDGAGQLLQGTANAFDGMNRLQVGGTDYAPAVAALSLADNSQSVLLPSQTLAGLTVSRKVTVPSAGGQDFARTVDSFQNTTANSITTTVTIVSNLGSDAATNVFATSDGTGVVSPNNQWIGTDDAIDGGGTPAVISVIHGPTGLLPTSVSLIGDNLTWTYSLTVPAGQTVRLATFTIQSMSRATAVAEANALVTAGGFGGEAGLLLSPAESASLLNFNFGVLSVTSTSIDSGFLVQGAYVLTVAFNKPVLGAGIAASYQLQSAGPDGLLGTADDITIPITSVTAGNPATISFAHLAPGLYRLTVLDTITDTLGNKLDGGDGLPDGNFVRDFVVIPILNNPMFGTASVYTMANSPTYMAVGDFNGDGKLDVAVANYSNVSVFLGNGSGGFAAAVTYSSGGSYPYAIVAGDFNGDGKTDLAVTNYYSGTVGVLPGNGDGTFGAAVTYSSGGTDPNSIAVGDFNGDGKQDLVVTNYFGTAVGVLLGNGLGGFAPVTTFSSGGSEPVSVAVGDFNGDGKQDVVVGNYGSGYGSVGLLLGNGAGGFAAPLIYSTGNGDGLSSLAVGDFNDDGHLDVAVANNWNGNVGVLLGNGAGGFGSLKTFSSGGSDPQCLAVGDFNRDGNLDLVVTNGSGTGTVGVLFGNGDGTFASAITYPVGGADPYGVVVADFNGDGYGDLAVANQSNDALDVLARIVAPTSVTLASPGGYNFDVQYGGYGAGQLVQGTANAFDGMNRLQVGGADYAPAVAAANLADSGQSVLLPSQTLAGLAVSRKVTVPACGTQDFARTIDSFTNSTANSITTTVTIVGNLGSDAATTVFATSDGTGVVSPNDQWIGTDDATDNGGTPAVISFIHGPLGLMPASVSLVGDNLTWTYSIIVPAGQTISLATFTIQSMSRATAVAEANALINGGGFAAQAAMMLTGSQLASIANFQFPGPTAVQLSASNVNEKQPAGTLVGTFSGTDNQPGATLTYSLPLNAAYPDNASFSIDAGGNLDTAAVFNAQVQASYTILVQCTDQYGYWYTTPFTIAVNDITPPSVRLSAPGTPGPTNATSLAFTVVFSEKVFNVAAGDFQLTATGTAAGTVTNVSASSGTTFTVTVGSITGDGTLRLDLMAGTTVHDAAGNVALPYASGGTVALEHTPPSVLSSTSSDPGPTTATSLTFTLLFSEPVYAVTAGDFQLVTTGSVVGTISSVSASSGTSITVAVTGIDGAGTLGLAVQSGSTILDAAGNVAMAYTAGPLVTIVDTPAAVVSITPSTAGPTNATSLTYSVLFSKNVYDVAAADFQLTAMGTAAGTVTSVSASSGSNFTVAVGSITGDGTLRLDLAASNTVEDVAGAAVPGFTSGGTTLFQHSPPSILSDTPSDYGPTTASSVSFTVNFSEPVSNVIPSDFLLTATGSALGTVATVSAASGTSFTVAVTGIDGSGTLRLDLRSGSTVVDAAGNTATGYASGDVVTVVDTPAAVVSITPSTAGPTNATSLSYSVLFTKNVYDVAVADFQLTATGTAAGTVASVSAASGSSFTVSASSISGDGTLRLDLSSSNTVEDVAGAGVPGFTSGGTTIFQHTPPSILSDAPSTPGPTTATSVTFTVAFSEAVYDVVSGDFQLTTTGSAVGTVTAVSASSGTSFGVTVVSIDGIGTLRLDLAGGSTIEDAAGNVATAYTGGGTTSIFLPATVTAITSGLASGLLTTNTTSVAVGFSLPVLGGGTASNFLLQGAGPDGLLGTADDTTIATSASYSGTTTTLSMSALAAGLYRLTVRDTITDTAGNPIDGNGNGQPGSNWVRDFVVVPVTPATFTSPVSLTTGSAPYAIVSADFNGDGFADLAVANRGSNNISVFLGDGTGAFASPVTYATGGSSPTSIVVGDFNGDGKPDIAVSNYGSNTIGVLLGNGNGTFAAAVTYATGGSEPDAIAVGDFNGDGKQDLAVANFSSGTVGILLGNGNGTFAPSETYATGGSEPDAIAVGDFNGDGKQDLAVANYGSGTVADFLGKGDGTFAAPVTYATGGSDPDAIAVGDFNGDGKQDLVVANFGSATVGILLGKGDGTFSSSVTYSTGGLNPNSIVAGDLNGDGKQDLAVAGYRSVGVLLGNGDGTFSAPVAYAWGNLTYGSLTLADFNGDGRPDLAVTTSNNTIEVLLNSTASGLAGAASYTPGGTQPMGVAVGDFNGDGRPDLAVANNYNGTVSVFLANASGGFSAPVNYACGAGPASVVVGDFNGDGKLDLAVADATSGYISVLLGNGDGTFAPAVSYASDGSEPYAIAVGDFNGDGKLDLASANYASNTVSVLLGNGNGTFASPTVYASGGSEPYAIAVGDFNGDGKPDLAVANYASNSVGVLLGNGNGTFASAVTYASGGSEPRAVALGDFNGDGKLDLAVANYGSSTVSVLLGNGNGTFASTVTYASGGSEPDALAVADLNGDGKQDLAAVNYASNTLSVLLGNGDGTFAAAATYPTGGNSPDALADFNGDGKPDLAVTNNSTNTVAVLLNAAGTLVQPLTSSCGTTYQVQTGGVGAGQVAAASDGAFNGAGRLRVGGQDYTPPLTTAGLANGNRTVVTPMVTMAGLYVSRKVTVPAAGSQDFVRTVDTFQNPTASPITTTVTLLGNLGSDAATTVFATSDGTGVVSPNDQWIGTDDGVDGDGTPAVILYIHGPHGLEPTSVQLLGDNVTWTYAITVPAGQAIELASYLIVADTQEQAIADANALVTSAGFGGHAADYLSPSNLLLLANFQYPISTTSVVSSSHASVVYGTAVTFTAAVFAQSGRIAPTAGGVDFFDTTTGHDLGAGSLGVSTGATSTWTLTTGAKTFNATAGDTVTATYTAGMGFAGSSGTTTEVVTAIPLTVKGITAANKTYNGNATATLQGLAAASPVGVLSGDTVTLGTSGAAGTFASKDVAQNILVSVSGLTLGGAQAGDYTLTQPTTTANIAPAMLTVSGITAADKVYNANTMATLSTPGAALGGVFSGDAVTLGTGGAAGAFASKNVAQNVLVSVSGLTLGGAQAGDYTLAQPATTANITPAMLTVSGITAADKVYNANTTATLSTAGVALGGVFSGDAVTLGTGGAAGTFASKDVAQNILVSVSGLTLGGAQAGNYTLTQPTTTANITPAMLTVSGITAANKIYNANTMATLSTAVAALAGVLSADAVTLGTGGAVGTFASKDVAQNIPVPVSGLTLGGAQAEDYTLTQPTTTANITARAITVTAVSNLKIYDGTTSAAAVPTIASGSLAAGDAAAFSEAYGTKNVGIDQTLTPSGSINDGNSGNNYAVTFVTSTVGAIIPRAITVTAASNTKVYDGTISATAAPTITSGSLAFGDTAAFGETYNTPAVGMGWTLAPAGTVDDGNGGANYSVTFVSNTSGAITQTVDHFAVTASPANVAAGNNFILTVTAEDAGGHIVTGYEGTVEFNSSDPLEPQPAGNFTFAPGSGVAAAMATLETAGSWAITATDTSNSSISDTTTVMVAAAPASKVVFGQQPANTSAGATITGTSSQAVTVELEDRYGNFVNSSTANVTITIASGPSGGKLLGTTTVQAIDGVGSFSNLSIDQAGSYSLSVCAAGVGGAAASGSFNVAAGAATQLAFSTEPANTPGAQTMASVVVIVEDQYGNTVTTDRSSVTLSLNTASGGGGGVLKGTATANASGGVATFSGLSIVDPSHNSYSAAGTGYTLWASDGSLMPAKSAAFNTTLIVTSCTMTPTGFVATLSQPFEVATTPVTIGPNLYSAVTSNNLPVNVALIGSNEGTDRGSLVVNSTDTQITFVATTLVHNTGLPIAGVSSPDATSGILAPDGYTVVLDSTSTSFVTTNGQLLDGTDSGTAGSNFNQFTAVNNSADVDVVIPSFARGPSSSTVTSVVNVPNVSTPIFANSVMPIASSAKNGATESGNTVTITTSSAHGLVAGQTVLITGFSGAYTGYNGTFTVASAPSTTTFTYTDSTTGLGTSGGGTATGYGLTESGNTVTVWATVANQLAVNEPVTISGAGVPGYNGTFTVTSLPGGASGTTFTYTDATAGLANSGGGTAALARGIPISLSGPTSGVTSGQFTLTYSSSDLAISGAVVDPNLAASYGATLSLDASSTPGNAIIDFSTTTALPSASGAPILLGGLTATVPSTAYYRAKDLLHFSSVTLEAGGSSVPTIGTDALHLVTFAGNASGSGAITSADVLDMARVVAGADAGFAAYPLIDPDVIGDLLGDGTVDGPDGALLGRYVNGVTTPQMPTYPGAPVNKLSIVGSTVNIPSASQLEVGSGVTVPGTVVDTALPVLPDLTTSVVAGPVAAVGAGATVKDAGGVSLYSGAPTVPTHVSQHAADGLFAALGGAVDVAELAVLGSSAEQTEPQALAAQMSAGGSVQANLDRLLWESEDSSWQDGERDWLS